MKHKPEIAPVEEKEEYVAGQSVPAGVYLDREHGREICLTRAGVLPASGDGRASIYVRRSPTWQYLQTQAESTKPNASGEHQEAPETSADAPKNGGGGDKR